MNQSSTNRFISLTVDVEQDCPPYLNTYRGIEEGMEKLLSLLDEEKISGTFFTTGEIAERYPKVIEEIVRARHELGCHGHSHRRFDRMDWREAEQEIRRSTKILRAFYPVVSFRAPNLQFPIEYLKLLEDEGYQLDSSEGKYKLAYFLNRKVKNSLKRIPASITSSILRLPKPIRYSIFKTLKKPIVLFMHPWEFVDWTKTNLRRDCRFRTGEKALECLKENIRFFKKEKNTRFCKMEDLISLA